MNKYFITTAIPYINAKPHIGHIQEFLLTKKIVDILKSNGSQVLWQSGTDDNSLKNLESALNQSLSLDIYLSKQINQFKELLKKLSLQPDYLVHTHLDHHHNFVKKFINNLNEKDLYVGKYEGLYCTGCEDFLKKEDLVNNLCPDHLKAPQLIQEENVFFKLSSYQQAIYNLIDSDKVKITPLSKKQEILSFISRGLEDISISRPVKNNNLGVDFPDFPDHKVYVWIDALINYLSGIDYYSKEGQNTWDQSFKIHVIGKNVWKFHAIYWIGLLLSAQITPPNEIYIHGFLTNNGKKISKSLGNSIDIDLLLSKHSNDELTYYLLGKLNPLYDSDFKEQEVSKFFTDDISFQVGNLFPRVFTLAQKFNYILSRKETNSTNDYSNPISLYQKLLEQSQKLNKEINDSNIWKKPTSEALQYLPFWERQLNLIADLLIVLFPHKKIEVNQSFAQKLIIFPKKD